MAQHNTREREWEEGDGHREGNLREILENDSNILFSPGFDACVDFTAVSVETLPSSENNRNAKAQYQRLMLIYKTTR